MEYLYFGIACLIFVLAVIGRGIYLDRKKAAEFEKSLRRDYGKLPKREISPERFLRMDRYFRKHPEKDQIDDITWNDLGMDEIFRGMNHTYSAIGEEYLYYTLRSAGHTMEQLEGLESLIGFFSKQEDLRVSVQKDMAKLGYMGKYSLYDYLDHLDYLGERSNRNAYLRNALFFLFLVLMPFSFSLGLIGMLVILIVNNLIYFREKGEIEPYIISFVYILRLVECAEKLEKAEKQEDVQKNRAVQRVFLEISEAQKALSPLKKGSFWVLNGNGSLGGDPAGMLMDYIKMAFHIDLICFNRMLSFLRSHASEVDRLCSVLGYIETGIAIGAYRKSLQDREGYAVPFLLEDPKAQLVLEAGYHPMLTEPVLNSISASKGVLITGSNASGKSTFLKTVAINSIFAQTIHTCTAKQYQAPCFRIFSSMALRDDLQGGESYYIVEIKALQRILTAAKEEGRPVLCFVDEVLRGTNTVERIAASTQILRSLATKNTLCFAATHDIELTELLEEEFSNYHFTEEIAEGDISFPYQLLKGRATTRNAIRLLEIIGYDRDIIETAEKLAEKFVREGVWT